MIFRKEHPPPPHEITGNIVVDHLLRQLRCRMIYMGIFAAKLRTKSSLTNVRRCNQWVPKIPGQRGLRILTFDSGGSRGPASVMAVRCLVESCGPLVWELFDMICGTSTGGIIAFLTGLRRESSSDAVERYNPLIGAQHTALALYNRLVR